MSGPPYPPPPRTGSNAIGRFAMGVSPIGDIPAFDVWTTAISQYANSKVLTRLVLNYDAYVDPTANFEQFFDLIWNVDTAQGHGLDVWGRIVGVSRTLRIPGAATFFGFQEATGAGEDTFGFAPFFSGQQNSENFVLTDSSFRTLIFAKALANISDGSIPSVNQLLLNLFPGRGDCYVKDLGGMQMEYHFDFALSAPELAIVSNSGVLPRPTGVRASVTSL